MWLCPYAKEVRKKVNQLCNEVTGVSNSLMMREAVLYEHLTKHPGTVSAHFDQFMSCVRSALWKSRSLLMYRHVKIEVANCVKMVPSGLQSYWKPLERTERRWPTLPGRGTAGTGSSETPLEGRGQRQ